MRGRFWGPARVLAMETKRSEDGSATPTHIVWIARAGRLLRCAPEQLRPASSLEEKEYENTDEAKTPWTFTGMMQNLVPGEAEDIMQ